MSAPHAIPDDVMAAARSAVIAQGYTALKSRTLPVARAILAERKRREGLLNWVREIITEWNFGTMHDRDALVSIFKIVGDRVQGDGEQ